ncbi:thiopeptide-type bacteriocin biosynthesis protein [Kitasatospora sp. NPDC057541]|uniref:thiopeptide-type bacteriocin biosynthesis protein n=1 Tax=unclassified Kitasatospora TaxID=2633591 RepID=UPI0036956701
MAPCRAGTPPRGTARHRPRAAPAPRWAAGTSADPGRCATAPPGALTPLLDTLAEEGLLTGWATVIDEPETAAFGGPHGMETAHRLFHTDSRHLTAHAAKPDPPTLGRTETFVVLASAMLRAARLDRHEQGEVWAKFADLRADPAGPRDLVHGAGPFDRVIATVSTRAPASPPPTAAEPTRPASSATAPTPSHSPTS